MFSTFNFLIGFTLISSCAGAPGTVSSSSNSSSSSSSSSSASSTTNSNNSPSPPTGGSTNGTTGPPTGGGGTPGGSNTTTGPSGAFIRSVLYAHNSYRRNYSAPDLAWADDLYQGVFAQTQTCNLNRTFGPYGENLFASTNLNATCVDAVNFWMAESANYDYNNPGFSPATQHFTQVVWRSTRSVACALSRCPAGTIFANQPAEFCACHYFRAGNVQGRYRENVRRPRRSPFGGANHHDPNHDHGDFDHDDRDPFHDDCDPDDYGFCNSDHDHSDPDDRGFHHGPHHDFLESQNQTQDT